MPTPVPIGNNPFSALLPRDSSIRQDSWRWGTVKQVKPLRVQLDGDTAALAGTPDTLTPVRVNDRVRVHIYNRRSTVIGVSGGAVVESVPYADSARIVRSEPLVVSAGKFRVAASTPAPRVYMQGGRVWLAGRAVASKQPTKYSYSGVYFTVPVWARPAHKSVFSLVFSGAVAVLTVSTDGSGEAYFYTDGDANNTVVFDGLSWPDPAIA